MFNLRGGQEHRNTNVDQQAALDLPHAAMPFDDVVFFAGFEDDPLPAANAIGLALAQGDVPFDVDDLLDQRFDL